MNIVSDHLNKIQNEFNVLINNYQKSTEKNIELFKILATVKCDLEKTLKNQEILNETVYKCIDLLRQYTPYFSTNEQRTKTDPPLTNEQKTLK